MIHVGFVLFIYIAVGILFFRRKEWKRMEKQEMPDIEEVRLGITRFLMTKCLIYIQKVHLNYMYGMQ